MRVFLLSGFLSQNNFICFNVICEDVNKAQDFFYAKIKNNYPNSIVTDLKITDLTSFLNKNGFYYKGNNK